MSVSSYYLAVLILLAALAVIGTSLTFAFRYHEKLLKVVEIAVAKGNVPITTEAGDVGVQSKSPLSGPSTGLPSEKLAFSVDVSSGVEVTWSANGGDPSSDTGTTFATSFAKAGSYEVNATYTDLDNTTHSPSRSVTIGSPSASSASTIVLPFVIKNWGRLVVVVFGVGVISALMSTRVLDAAAGIGILGTLLGVGVVTATSGTTGGKPTPPEE